MRGYSCKMSCLLMLALAGIDSGLAAQQQQSDKTAVLGHGLLDSAYVDIRHGFSVRPPFGSELSGTTVAGAIQLAETEPLAGATPLAEAMSIAKWELLKQLESKELVCFVQAGRGRFLAVSLLVPRHKMKIEQILKARKAYWLGSAEQASVEQTDIDTVDGRPTAMLNVAWRTEPHKPLIRTIREALIQSEKKRYFCLALVSEPMTNETKLANQSSPTDDELMRLVLGSFSCFDKKEGDRRWAQARKSARQLLSQLDFHEIKRLLEPQSWFRIQRDGKNVGFFVVREQFEPGPTEAPQNMSIKIRCLGFVHDSEDATILARMLGWSRGRDDETALQENWIGPARLEGEFVLDSRLRGESFQYRITVEQNVRQGLAFKGRWHEGQLDIKRYDDIRRAEATFSETIEARDSVFLPWSEAHLLGRLMDRKVPSQYVFLRYSNGALCYYSLRICAKTSLVLSAPALGGQVSGQTSEQTGGQADRQAGGQTSEQAARRLGKSVKAVYLVGQTGAAGPIVATWLDTKGRVIKQSCDGLVLTRSSAAHIKQLWPKQTKPERKTSNGRD